MHSVPYGSDQNSNLVYAEDIDDISRIVDSYVKRHKVGDSKEYYLHIDHLHIFPPNERGRYPMLIIFHRVYLHKEVANGTTED